MAHQQRVEPHLLHRWGDVARCKGEGLRVSGTNRERAQRLIDHGLTHEEVLAKYSWRARRERQYEKGTE